MAKSQVLIDAEARIKELELEKEQATTDMTELVQENSELKETVTMSKEAQARLTQEIEDMEIPTIVDGRVEGSNLRVYTTTQYKEHSEANGRYMGRRLNQKTKMTIEELRVLINSKWTPKMVMDKHGLTEGDLQQLVWKLSKREMRDKPIKYSIELNFFSREG